MGPAGVFSVDGTRHATGIDVVYLGKRNALPLAGRIGYDRPL